MKNIIGSKKCIVLLQPNKFYPCVLLNIQVLSCIRKEIHAKGRLNDFVNNTLWLRVPRSKFLRYSNVFIPYAPIYRENAKQVSSSTKVAF